MQKFNNSTIENKSRSLARFAFFLGGGLILIALAIGFISYKYSFKMMERSYQNFYLNKAQLLLNTVQDQTKDKNFDLTQALARTWKRAKNRPEDEYICVVDKAGNLILHTQNPASVGSYAGDNQILSPHGTHEGNLCSLVENRSDYVGEYISSDNKDQIAAFINIPQKDWLLGIHRSKEALEKEIRDGFFPLVTGFFSVCGLLMPLALFLQYRNYSSDRNLQLQMEGQLLQSEQRYQSLVDTMPQCMYRTDLKGKLTFANKAFLNFMDCLAENCLGKPLQQITYPDLARKQAEQDSEIISSGKTIDTVEEYSLDNKGNSHFIELVKCPVFDSQKQVIELQGIFWDVTDKKLAEARLKKTKAELQTVLQSVPSGIIAVDVSGRITLINQKAEEILDVDADEVLGCPVNHVTGTNLYRVMLKNKAEFGLHFLWGDKSLLVSRSPVHEPSVGVIGGVSIFHDESELEQVQKQLDEIKRIRDELSLLVENSHDGVLIADAEKIHKVNPSFSRITGLAPAAVEGQNIHELKVYDHTCLNTFKQVIEHVLNKKESLTVRSRLKSDNNIFVTGTPVLDRKNNVVRVVINLRDVTELHSLEKQIKRLSVKSVDTELDLQRTTCEQAGIVAESLETRRVVDVALRVARVDSTVLLSGESGVGKDVLANLIHNLSHRHDQPFISINCGAIPGELLESELFGYEKGAFSGANSSGKPGLFERANRGCIFLDEIAELPLQLQVKLLKVLQDQKCRRLGSVKDIDLDLRIIAATNKNLKQMVQQESFREDLFYRLYVVPIEVPSLRERREDILPLAVKFLKANNQKYNMSKTLSTELLDVLEAHTWPGNIRELQNVIERMVVTADADILEPRHLPGTLQAGQVETTPRFNIPQGMGLREALASLEQQMLSQALYQGGTARQAADILGVAHTTVTRKAKKYDIYPDNGS